MEKRNDEFFINIELLKKEPEKDTLLYEFCRDFGFHPDQIKGILQSIEGISGKIWYSTEFVAVKDRNFIIISKIPSNNFREELIYKDTEIVFEPLKLSFRSFRRTEDYKIFSVGIVFYDTHFSPPSLNFVLSVSITSFSACLRITSF
jgi:tRNA(Ile)-lysidine synthase